MKIAVTKHSKDLSLLHQDIKKTNVCLDLQKADLGEFRRKLAMDGMKLGEKRRHVFMRSLALLPTEPSTFIPVMGLPYLRSDTIQIYDRLLDVPNIGKWRRSFQQLLEEILKMGDTIDFFGKIPMGAFAHEIPMLPVGTDPVQFFASSTLPAFFGFCWASETQNSYFHLLSRITKRLNLTGSAFRSHWVFECYKAYILSSNMSTYLRSVFKFTVTKLLTCVSGQSVSQRVVDELVGMMAKLITTMIEKLPIMPRDVRLMLKMLFEAFENEQDGLDNVEMLICECILQPVYSNPKIYGIVLDTLQFEKPAFMDGLGRMWSFIRHPDLKDPEFAGVNIASLYNLNFEEFLKAVIDLESTSTSPSIVSFLDLAGISNIQLLFSISDITLLSFLSTFTGIGGETILECAKSISEIASDFDFCCFRFNLWNVGFYGIPRSLCVESEWKGTTVERHKTVQLLCKLLTISPVRTDEPSGITDFLQYEEHRSHIDHDFKAKAVLSTLINEIAVLRETPPILDETFSEIEDRKEMIRSNYSAIADIKEIDEQILKLVDESETRAHELNSVIAGNFVLRLLQMRPSIMQTFSASKIKFVTHRNAFREFFRGVCFELEGLVSPLCPYLLSTALIHLHSHFLRFLPVDKFAEAHARFKNSDAAFETVKPLKITEISGPVGTVKSRYLFKVAARELIQARRLEIPLEAVKCVVRAMKAITDAMEICGETSSKYEQLLCRVALSTHAKQLYSFVRYLEFFLDDMSYKEIRSLLTTEERRALISLIEMFVVLDRILSKGEGLV